MFINSTLNHDSILAASFFKVTTASSKRNEIILRHPSIFSSRAGFDFIKPGVISIFDFLYQELNVVYFCLRISYVNYQKSAYSVYRLNALL